MKKLLVFSPALLLTGFVFNLYLGNIDELFPQSLIAPIAVGLLVSFAVTAVFSAAFRSLPRGVSFSSMFVVSVFVFGRWPILGIGAIIAGFIFCFKFRGNFAKIAQFFLITGAVIFIMAGFRVASYEIKRKETVKTASPLILPKLAGKNDMPDIYYIVPDSYSSSKSLKKYYGFDNSDFEKFLTDKGFYIASDSASNYPKTFLSLGSSLNMEYLDYLSAFENSTDLTKVDPLMEDNNVVKLLKSLGYKYYHLGSWWGATKTNHNADQNIILENENPIRLSQFDNIVLQSTILNPVLGKLLPKIAVGDSDLDRMNRTNYQFQKLGEAAFLPGPKFVFAHVIAPHEPYFYDANCQYTKPSVKSMKDEYIAYIAHLTCVNKKLEKSVGEILENSKRPPVIIIQSDEGAPFLAEELKPVDAWGKASESLLREKFPVFNAYLLPEGESDLYPLISPVNSFRLVFNRFLGTNFPRLPDRSYILPDLQHLYDFVDISDKIR